MPRTPIDHSKTLIYKIVCLDLSVTEIYVGHTTDFIRRKSEHKNSWLKKDYKLYVTIRAQGGWENWQMVEIEKWPCADGNEARSRERFWYENLNATLNMVIPISSEEEKQQQKKEYYIDNADKINEKAKDYRSENRDQINEKAKDYRSENRDQLNEKAKDYRSKNRDQLNEKAKDYRSKNRDQINEKAKKYRVLK